MIFNYQGIQICDISTYQESPHIPGSVDFYKMRDWGFRAVGIRAGLGSVKDLDFDANWNGARGILPRFSYFAYLNSYPPTVQANKYWDIVEGERDGPCVWDLEDRASHFHGMWKAWDEAEPGTQPAPTPTPAPSLPAYFTAHDEAGNELARYNKQ